jgi:beta-phosphoglucomutase family hydrolase
MAAKEKSAAPAKQSGENESEQISTNQVGTKGKEVSTPADSNKNGDTAQRSPEISPKDFDAVLFDMDGVVTRTATVHFQAWKSTFDDFLKQRDGDSFKSFTQQDYLDYVDGMPREDGVKCFLKSRKIDLPEGDIEGIAQKKDKEFMRLVHTNGVEPYETTIALIRALRSAGVATALVTASKNGEEVLKVTKLTQLFDATVTGVDAAKLKLNGKPAPDVFLEAAKRLSVKPDRAIVVEDAESGVQAGHRGHFKMVIGVARQGNMQSLKDHGASVVVRDLAEVTVPQTSDNANCGMTMADLDVTDANWTVTYDDYAPEHEMKRESLCAMGNGKFCTRGTEVSAQSDDNHYPGTYVAGGYNSIWLESGGSRFEREELVNMPNWLCLTFKILPNDNNEKQDAEWFSIDKVEILEYKQTLNLKEGILYRDMQVKDKHGRETKISARHFVHMKYSHLAGLDYVIEPLNWSGKVVVRSAIDGSILNSGDQIDPKFKANKHLTTLDRNAKDDIIHLKVITNETRFAVAMSARTIVIQDEKSVKVQRDNLVEEEFVGQDIHVDCHQNKPTRIEKTVALFTSRDRGVYEAGASSREFVEDAASFPELIESQIEAWRSLWYQFDLFIETKEEFSKLVPSLLVHLNSFHTLQTASTHTVDLDNGVPARGWTGEGYQGHVFWDELFVFPFINLRMPNISASLLKYRYRRLVEARKIAKSYGARGACFPWQSASDGRERTPEYWWQPATSSWIRDYTHLEIHVNGAIAFNVWQYYQVTADLDFMYSYGSEILIEIARFFATFAKKNEQGRFEIKGVIGPDEFHNGYPNFTEPGVNNNAYTNILASWTCNRVLDLLEDLPTDHRDHLVRRLEISDDEISLWQEVSEKMYVPIMTNGIIAQFDGYEELEDFPGMKDNQVDHEQLASSLSEHFGYLNQYKISKQADALMLGFLFSQCELDAMMERLAYPKECVNLEKLARYYIPRTANESTLSRVALAWVLSRLDRKLAYELLGGDYDNRDKIIAEARHNSGMDGADDIGNDGAVDGNGHNRKDSDAPVNPKSKHEQIVDFLPETTPGGLFYAALGSDYFDVAARGTAKSGIHMGAMAGTVDIVQRCYTGISMRDDILWIDPKLPEALVRLSFTLHYRDQSLHFDLNHDRTQICARHSSAHPIKIGYKDQVFELNAGETKVVPTGIKPS